MKSTLLSCQLKLASSCFRTALFGFILLAPIFFSKVVQAETLDTRSYKISVLIFKHLPADKNTPPRLIDRWTDQTFAGSIDSASLSSQPSALAGSYYTLSHDKNYTILYHESWVSPLEYEKPIAFHFHKTFDSTGNILDGLINVTLKYNLDIHFQTQLLTPNTTNGFKTYTITALDESYQTPSNQLQYIDGPIYGALVLITRYGGK